MQTKQPYMYRYFLKNKIMLIYFLIYKSPISKYSKSFSMPEHFVLVIFGGQWKKAVSQEMKNADSQCTD